MVTAPHRRLPSLTPVLVLLPLAAACLDDAVGPTQGPNELVTIQLEQVGSGFSSPLFVTAPVGDAARLFVVERGGTVRIIDNGAVLPTPFLDVSASITAGGERGLLGMAFHPDYATNGHFYVNYTDLNDSTQVVRFTVSTDPDVADGTSGLPILAVGQPYANHNGGMLAFGPDRLLYVGMGDGGGGGDPLNNAQSPANLLGSVLRLDVDGGSPYVVPSDNPFVGHATYREETWAYGLRNPWRFSFDRETGDFYIGDVGQNAREEIDFQPASSTGGENYGWRIMEGVSCYSPASGCSMTGLTLPIYDYPHASGCSVTGGYVYRGSDYPWMTGRYFFGDYCSGWIRSFEVVDGAATDVQSHAVDIGAVSQLSSFGEDGVGELYVVSLGGIVYKIVGIDPEA